MVQVQQLMLSLQDLCVVSIERQLMPVEIVLFHCLSYMHNKGDVKPSRLASTLVVIWYDAFGIAKTVSEADRSIARFLSSGLFAARLYFIDNAVLNGDWILTDIALLRRCVREQLLSETFPQLVDFLGDMCMTRAIFDAIGLDLPSYGISVKFGYVYWYERLVAEGGFKIETMFRAIKRQSKKRRRYHKTKR